MKKLVEVRYGYEPYHLIGALEVDERLLAQEVIAYHVRQDPGNEDFTYRASTKRIELKVAEFCLGNGSRPYKVLESFDVLPEDLRKIRGFTEAR